MQFLFFQAKEELLRVIGLQEEEGSSLEFLRRGYKVHLILAKQLIAASKHAGFHKLHFTVAHHGFFVTDFL